MEKYDGYIRIGTKIDTSKVSTQMATMENRLMKAAQRVQVLKTKLEQLEKTKTPTEEYKNLEKDLAAANREAEKLWNTQAKLSQKGTFSQEFADAKSEYMSAREYADQLEAKMSQLVADGKAFTLGKDSGEYKKISDDLMISENALAVLNQKHDELVVKENEAAAAAKKLEKSGVRAFSKMNKEAGKANGSIKKSTGHMQRTSMGLGRILSQMLMFNMVYSVINAASQAIGSLVKSDTELSSSLAQIKGNLLTAFAPIYYYILPAIKTLLSFIVKLTSGLAYLVSAIFGKSISQSQKLAKGMYSAATATKKSARATKENQKTLADFDEMHILTKNDKADQSGEASDGAIAPAFNLSDQKKPEWVQWIEDHLQGILTLAGAIGAAFLAWKIASHFTDDLGILAGVAMVAGGAVLFISGAFDAWQNGMNSGNLLEMLAGAALIIGGLALVFGPLGAAIGAIVTGIGLLVVSIHDMITNGINAQNTIGFMAGVFLTVVGVLTAVAGVSAGVAVAIGAIAAVVAGVVIAVIKDWDNFKNTVLTPFHEACKVVKGNIQELVDAGKNILSSFLQFFKDVFSGNFKAAGQDLVKFFTSIFDGLVAVVKIAVNTLIGILNVIWGVIKGIYNAIARLINSIDFKAPDWVPGIGGKRFKPNLPIASDNLSIPYLADGAVIPGGHEFIAMLGDQPRGQTNIETPLSTMVDAFKQALSDMGSGNATSNINLDVYLDGNVVYSDVVKINNRMIRQHGKNPLAF